MTIIPALPEILGEVSIIFWYDDIDLSIQKVTWSNAGDKAKTLILTDYNTPFSIIIIHPYDNWETVYIPNFSMVTGEIVEPEYRLGYGVI